jgi:hypothetical protein
LSWSELPGNQRGSVTTQIMQQMPLLWIWDDLTSLNNRGPTPTNKNELLTFLRSVHGAEARMLLISRGDEQSFLGDLPARVLLLPMPVSESSMLLRAAAARNGADLIGLDATSPMLTATDGASVSPRSWTSP